MAKPPAPVIVTVSVTQTKSRAEIVATSRPSKFTARLIVVVRTLRFVIVDLLVSVVNCTRAVEVINRTLVVKVEVVVRAEEIVKRLAETEDADADADAETDAEIETVLVTVTTIIGAEFAEMDEETGDGLMVIVDSMMPPTAEPLIVVVVLMVTIITLTTGAALIVVVT